LSPPSFLPRIDLETAKSAMSQLKFHAGRECVAEYTDLIRGSMALTYGAGVQVAHQRGARDWKKAKLKFMKGNLFSKLAQQENESLKNQKKAESKGQTASEGDVVVVLLGSVSNQADLEFDYDLSEKDSMAELILAAYLKGYVKKVKKGEEDMVPEPEPACFFGSMQGDWVCLVYDNKRQYVLASTSRTGSHRLHWGTSFTDGSMMFSTCEKSIEKEASSGPSSGEFPRGTFYQSHSIYDEAPKWDKDIKNNRRGQLTSFMRRKSEIINMALVTDSGEVTDDITKNNLSLGFRTESEQDLLNIKPKEADV